MNIGLKIGCISLVLAVLLAFLSSLDEEANPFPDWLKMVCGALTVVVALGLVIGFIWGIILL